MGTNKSKKKFNKGSNRKGRKLICISPFAYLLKQKDVVQKSPLLEGKGPERKNTNKFLARTSERFGGPAQRGSETRARGEELREQGSEQSEARSRWNARGGASHTPEENLKKGGKRTLSAGAGLSENPRKEEGVEGRRERTTGVGEGGKKKGMGERGEGEWG